MINDSMSNSHLVFYLITVVHRGINKYGNLLTMHIFRIVKCLICNSALGKESHLGGGLVVNVQDCTQEVRAARSERARLQRQFAYKTVTSTE